jgi:hypothetical protein
MKATTHMLVATGFVATGNVITGNPPQLLAFLVAALTSLLPDIDRPRSRVSRLCPPLSRVISTGSIRRIYQTFGHRTITHSVFAWVGVSVLFLPLKFVPVPGLYGAAVLGYISHALLDTPLLCTFGYTTCPDQSTLQETLNCATPKNVAQLQNVAKSLFTEHNLLKRQFHCPVAPKQLTLDFDLSAQPSSKRAEKATKGYFAKRKNSYGRQLARISVAQTSEILADHLYGGNMLSSTAFKEMVTKMEETLNLSQISTRRCIRLRLDGGFGTDENINFALSRGYRLLVKMYSGNRARKLAKTVDNWQAAKTATPQKNGEKATREVAWITRPHRYCRKTRQIAIRTTNTKTKCGYSYCVIVTTDPNGSLSEILSDYDKRSGIPFTTLNETTHSDCVF